MNIVFIFAARLR